MNLQDVKSSILILTAYECCYEGWKMRVDGSKNKWLETASWSDTHRLSETSTVQISCRRIGERLVKLVGTHSPRYVKFICIYFVDSSLHPLSFFLSFLAFRLLLAAFARFSLQWPTAAGTTTSVPLTLGLWAYGHIGGDIWLNYFLN